jgi:uncharacterized protein
MVVGILQVELVIDEAQSLKDKRRVVASVKDRLHREHQVSVAEVASHDDRHVAILGIALAGVEVAYTQSVLDRIVEKLRVIRGAHLGDHTSQILTGM